MAGLLSKIVGKIGDIGRGIRGLFRRRSQEPSKPTFGPGSEPLPEKPTTSRTELAQRELGKLGLHVRRDRARRFMGTRGPIVPGPTQKLGQYDQSAGGTPRGEGKPETRPGLLEPLMGRIPDGWVTVVSSNINALRYDKVLHAIDTQYKDGRVARYFNISPAEAIVLFTRSHGGHNWDIIRVRGKGNKHKHKKPWKYVGDSGGMF